MLLTDKGYMLEALGIYRCKVDIIRIQVLPQTLRCKEAIALISKVASNFMMRFDYISYARIANSNKRLLFAFGRASSNGKGIR